MIDGVIKKTPNTKTKRNPTYYTTHRQSDSPTYNTTHRQSDIPTYNTTHRQSDKSFNKPLIVIINCRILEPLFVDV